MHINYIRLHKYKRLMLSNIQDFEWSPKKNLLVILGANGSGKSSIIEELSPLPSRHVNFETNGIKEFKCTHESSNYYLKSIYDRGTGNHSFIKDGVELNSGNTFKVQEELCQHEFGITREIHQIATGKIKFSNLSTAKRRELLTRMSPVDLIYAFDVYNKVRQEHRSQKGVIDLLTKRLVNENHDIPSNNELTLLKEDSKRLSDRLSVLFENRVVTHDKPYNSLEEANRDFNNIVEKTHRALKHYVNLPDFVKVKDVDSFDRLVNELTNVKDNNANLINRLAEELEKLKRLDDNDFESMELELATLKKENGNLEKFINDNQLKYNGIFPTDLNLDSISDLSNLEAMFKQWYELVISFPVNENRYFSRESANVKSEQLKQNKAELITLENRLVHIRTRLTAIKDCKSVECPQCNHSFKPGTSEEEYESLKNEALKIPDLITTLESKNKELSEYLEAFEDYYSYVLRYSRLTKEFPQYNILWDFCIRENIMFVNPSLYGTDILNWFNYMKTNIEIKIKTNLISQNQKRIDNLEKLDKDTINYVNKRRSELHTEIDSLYNVNNEANLRLQRLASIRNAVNTEINNIENILNEFNNWKDRCIRYRDYLLMQGYNSEIHELQIQLAETTKELSNLEQRETTIKTLEGEVNNASVAHSDLTLLNKALSPSGGLIGRYLLTFMQGVVSLVNAYIGEVWSHSLEVLPSRIDHDELNYYFPINANNGAVVTDDISEGSESQVDIINFAFRLTILKLLKINDIPLYLDEFGRTFDEQHKDNLIPVIMNMIDNGLFKQVFFVSHLEGIHGAFNLAEFVVVNTNNITVPDVYNENVAIK